MKKLILFALCLNAALVAGRFWQEMQALRANAQVVPPGSCVSTNGDVDGNGALDLTDAISLLGHLFIGTPQSLLPLCVAQEPDLLARITALEQDVAELQIPRASLADLACAAGQVPTWDGSQWVCGDPGDGGGGGGLTAEQAAVLGRMSLVELPTTSEGGQALTVRFSGVNVQIVNGSGATNGHEPDPSSTEQSFTDGTGNLIVGYQEMTPDGQNTRIGSHNLVVGSFNDYSSFGGLIAGRDNDLAGPWAAVTGGQGNTAIGLASSVTGGVNNMATGENASVSGGDSNTAAGASAAVVGGLSNHAGGDWSSIGGGFENQSVSDGTSILGGSGNTTLGTLSTVSGGAVNTANGQDSSVGGGRARQAHGDWDWTAGCLLEVGVDDCGNP
jgi:hypothetical protein